MAKLALARGHAGGPDSLVGLAVAYALSSRATPGLVESTLVQIGSADSALGQQARWLAAALSPQPLALRGMVKEWAIVGPFRDTGGGLLRKEGPEGEGQRWGDRRADYSWGSYSVRWRGLPPELSTALGVPLELVIHPRQESCTYLATRVNLGLAVTARIYVAAAGSVRLLWDGVEAARSEEVHPGMVFDRLAVDVSGATGEHLLALKVCSAPQADSGRVRVRFTDAAGRELAISSSAELAPVATRLAGGAAARPLPTLLGEALRSGGTTAEQLLLAAALRTLGRADDLRSQRAPGLLFEAAAAAVTPDAMAFVAYLSGFGANRSGWFNLARERAVASGDAATASFALRNLALSRSRDGSTDWALAALGSEPLAGQTDSEALLIRTIVQVGSRVNTVRRAAVARLAERAEADGAATSIAIWEELAESAAPFDAHLVQAACRQLSRLDPRSAAARCFASAAIKDAAQLRAAARAALSAGALTSVSSFTRVGDMLAEAGLRDDALTFYRQLSELAPNRAAVWLGLSKLLFQAAGPSGAAERTAALQALTRAHELDPTSSNLRAAASLRTGDAAPASAADAALLVEPASFLARQKPPAVLGQVAERTLHSMLVVVMHADRRVSELTHTAREIVIEPRGQRELVDVVPSTEILRARVHRPDGSVALPREQVARGSSTSLRWPELHVGDVVEVAYRTWTWGPVGGRHDPPFYFYFTAGSVNTRPLLHCEVIVISPLDRPLATDVIDGKAQSQSSTIVDGNQRLHLIWDHPPVVPEEPLAPALTELVPVVVGSTFGSWGEFRGWYQNAVAGFTETDAQIQKLAAQLTAGKTTREDKLRALFNYVADSIRYVNYQSAEAWLPNRPQQLLARKQGDCDDKAVLLITLLRAVGIEANLVLIQTRHTSRPALLGSVKAAVPFFDHGIAFLPGEGGGAGVWLDATSPNSRLGPLSSMDARAPVLFIDRGPPVIQPSPSGAASENGLSIEWTLALDADGNAELTADELAIGDQAYFRRGRLTAPDTRQQGVEDFLIDYFPTVQVYPSIEFAPELQQGAARLHYRARMESLARQQDRSLVVPISSNQTMTAAYAPLLQRTLPVVVPSRLAPSQDEQHIRIIAPAGFRPGVLPVGGTEDGGEFGSASLQIGVDPADPRSVVLTRKLTIDKSIIPADQYKAWRGFLQRVDALHRRSIRFVPQESAGSAK